MIPSASGELSAALYPCGKTIRVVYERGIITALSHLNESPDPGAWLAPALVDLQVNGYAGVDFQRDGLTVEDLLLATRALRRDGCTRCLPTLITAPWDVMIRRLRHLRELRSRCPELRDSIAGWHIEGPFLSAEPGFSGAHNPAWMLDPRPEHILELRRVSEDDLVLLTLAPERNGALESIALATQLGMRVSLGHTNAPAEILQHAIRVGARGFTHLGNGCAAELNRHDNILWRVLDSPGLVASLIPDRVHIPPLLFRVFHKVLTADSILYVTDAMAAAGAEPGRYHLGEMEMEVGPDGVVRRPGSPYLAGSALQPLQGVFLAAEMLQCSWREAWRRFSEGPARFLGLKWELAIGQRLTFCHVSLSSSTHNLNAIDKGDPLHTITLFG